MISLILLSLPTIDLILIPVAYIYVFGVIGLATYLKRINRLSGPMARKFVHLGIGVLVIIAPILFTVNTVPTIIGITFIFITFITSPISPIPRLRLAAFKEGHDFGTVFYSITLTILLYFFFDNGWIIQAGFLPLVFGDAMANVFGIKYGKTQWKLVPSKTVEGSLAAFTSSSVVLLLVLSLYKILGLFPIYWYLLVILSLLEALVAATAELISPYGLDNLTIPVFCTSVAIWIGSFSPNIVVYLG